MAEPFVIHPNAVLREGLKFCNFDLLRQHSLGERTRIRLFKSHYGRHPLHLSRVYRDLQVHGETTRKEARDISFFHAFLLANNFLRCYEEGDLRFSRFDIPITETADLTWDLIQRVANLKKWKIQCPTVWPAKLGASCDGTHTENNEPRDPDMRRNPKNYSYKHNYAGLNYQIVLSLWTNQVFYACAGDPGRTHDMTAIRKEFIDMVPTGCRVIADAGYTGKTEEEKKIFAVDNSLDSDEVKKFKGKAKARQEQFNSRMKSYKCLKSKFRHGVRKHKICFAAILVLVQYAIEDTSSVGEPLITL